ncbi:MAG: hypothetical protein HC785_28805 [Calothrix sp. CSU_2_0]|nr:hypothetical protein [Calothrix sp. CSU_2_0]
MSSRLEKLQKTVLDKLAQQGGELDVSCLYFELDRNDRVLLKKALHCLQVDNCVNVDFGQVTQKFLG